MSEPTDNEQDIDGIHELFAAEELALAEARSIAAWHEHRLAELTKAYPDVAALRQPALESTLSALRGDDLNAILQRINLPLKLTGEEEDYWLQLWDYARANLGVTEDLFDDMTRERLADIVDVRLPEFLATQKPQTWSRSRNPGTAALYDRVRELRNAGHTQLQMCERLDAQKWPLPDLVAWRDLTWRAAFLSPKYNGAVKKRLSKITSVTS